MFRDLLDEDGHILTHNFRPIQPLGDRVVLFNIINPDDDPLYNGNDDIPPDVVDDAEAKNVLNDSPDNSLDDKQEDGTRNEKAKLKGGCSSHFVSMFYLLSITIVTLILSV